MNHADTSLGGTGQRFPETTMGFAGTLASGGRDVPPEGVETLSRRYWKPVYSYIRIAWAKSNEDAKDLTQAFFAWLLEGTALGRFDPSRGSFRTYLKTLLRRFVGHEEEALRARKRGGGSRILSLDGSAPEIADLASDPRTADPERIFRQVWAVEFTQHCLSRLRERYEGSARPLPFRLFAEYALAAPETRPTYAALARTHGIPEREVESHLARLREELRAEMRAELARQAGSEEAAREEWNELFGT